MLYSSCPSCGKLLASKIIDFEKKKYNICSNNDINDDDKQKQLTHLLLSLNLKRYCCRMRVMTYKDTVLDIEPVHDKLNN